MNQPVRDLSSLEKNIRRLGFPTILLFLHLFNSFGIERAVNVITDISTTRDTPGSVGSMIRDILGNYYNSEPGLLHIFAEPGNFSRDTLHELSASFESNTENFLKLNLATLLIPGVDSLVLRNYQTAINTKINSINEILRDSTIGDLSEMSDSQLTSLRVLSSDLITELSELATFLRQNSAGFFNPRHNLFYILEIMVGTMLAAWLLSMYFDVKTTGGSGSVDTRTVAASMALMNTVSDLTLKDGP